MCGICGVFNLDSAPVHAKILEHMADAIAHRGPDGDGYFIDQNIGFGHRRLAVIDLSADADQPMSSGLDGYTLVYNGEIYNYRELRKELTKLGHGFKTKSDTEVVLRAYIAWGKDCVDRFNGMFAFAIWDKSKQYLFLARDRYGIKPLYYIFTGNTFVFASEQKALLKHPEVKVELDLEALLEYFTFQNIFTDRTLIKDIRLFPAGSTAILPAGMPGNKINVTRYWDYSFQEPETHASEQEYLEELSRLFEQAVKRQLVSDVELGCYLSGGMDSGSITAIAANELPYIKTFTCGFDLHSASGLELAFDEREKSELMSYLFKTEHYEMVLKAGDMERVLPQLTWHLEEPRVGQSYPNYYVAQLAGKFVKVVLSGTGGDEIFGGYPWRYYRAVVNADFDDYIDKYYLFWQRLIPNKLIQAVFKPIWKDVKHVWTRDIFHKVFNKHAHKLTTPEDYINHSLYFEASTFLHGLLIVEDKLSMAHGLESRVPFLDNDLVDFGMRLPVNLKLGNLGEVVRLNENDPGSKTKKFFNKTKDGKLLLRKAMAQYIPKVISEGEKLGFSAPDASWYKGESIDYVKDRLFADNAKIYDFMDRDTVKGLINEHMNGEQNRRLLIWSLLNFEQWCDSYLG